MMAQHLDGICRCMAMMAAMSAGLCQGRVPVVPVGPQVVVVSLDGFGHHYLARYPGPHLARLYSRGAYPDRFTNQFATKTFPNHWSVATGVYEEVHGVVGNTVYDQTLNTILTVDDQAYFTQNPALIPIWTLNERQGGHSGCIMWPGCRFPHGGTNVTFKILYKGNAGLREKVDAMVEWLTHARTPANLVMLYHDQPDRVGHIYGPDSPQVLAELKKIDDDLGYLYSKLEMFELREGVDIILLSDHGMSEVKEENIIDLTTIIDMSKIRMTGSSPVLNIWPYPGVTDLDVYIPLKDASVSRPYRVLVKDQSDDLVAWHFHDNPRISSLTLLAQDGYVFQDFWNMIHHYEEKGFPNLTTTHGDHGYPVSSPNMDPIFVAAGPSFRRSFQTPPFSNLDVYPLLCHILGLVPGPHNGSLGVIGTTLARPTSVTLIQPLVIGLGCTVVLVGLVGAVACALTRRDRKQTVSADTLINGYIYRKTMQRQTKQPLEDISEEECLLEAEVEDV